jgi:Bacteriocin-protection, YdeI or OmpD-Associated
MPADLRTALIANARALDAWKDITPLARKEFICWVEADPDAATPADRAMSDPRRPAGEWPLKRA